MCQFSDQITSKEVFMDTENTSKIIDVNEQCRGMSTTGQEDLLSYACIDPSNDPEAFRCKDDVSSFWFRNDAVWHYQYSSNVDAGVYKNIDRQIEILNLDPGSIDVVVANCGNGTPLTYESLLSTAQGFSGSGTLIIWLTTYTGSGKFNEDEMHTLEALGVVQVDLGVMLSDRRAEELRVATVEEKPDGHYCLPGPPDEVSILILQIIWAYFHEQRRG